MLINNISNQNVMYLNSLKQINENDNIKKDDKSSEATTEDLSQSNYSNMNIIMENQDNINRHMLINPNMNQFIPNEILMNKNYIQQQNYNRLPPTLYNMPMIMEQNPQIFNNINNQNNNFLFGNNEDMKHKKMKMKIQKSPNEGNLNINPNINMNMMNISNLNFPCQNMNNNKFFKNNNTNNNLSLNKGSLSMQGNKNTIPNFNPNVNFNFMIQKSPQAPQNTIPNNIINGQNLNMPQRNFYNPNNNNMNKRHQHPYKRVNSDKNLLGIENKNKNDLYNHSE